VRVLESDGRMFQTVAVTADGKHVAAATTPHALVWDVASGQPPKRLKSGIVDAFATIAYDNSVRV
jgi:hypothetical protein